jgi:predicted metal-dependent phosphoesterase TrpH
LIDLHTHTTASDGRCTPAELVDRAAAGGVSVLAVTDHDTVAGCAAAAEACARANIAFVAGIEITAVLEERDVHVLGYFVDTGSSALQQFLAEQRQRRIDRIREIAQRLAAHGVALDIDAILQPGLADASRAVGRPWIARALVASGHVADVAEAFERWLSPGRPAFVPRIAAEPEEVFRRIHDAGGLASLAHPVQNKRDDRIPHYVAGGLDALEVYHTDHDAAATARYLALASSLNLAVTGGSDFHGDEEHGGGGPGRVSLPREDYERLLDRRPT